MTKNGNSRSLKTNQSNRLQLTSSKTVIRAFSVKALPNNYVKIHWNMCFSLYNNLLVTLANNWIWSFFAHQCAATKVECWWLFIRSIYWHRITNKCFYQEQIQLIKIVLWDKLKWKTHVQILLLCIHCILNFIYPLDKEKILRVRSDDNF